MYPDPIRNDPFDMDIFQNKENTRRKANNTWHTVDCNIISSCIRIGHLPLASSYVNISPLQLPKQLSQIEQCKIIKVRLTVSNQWQVTILLLSLLRLAA